MADISIKKCGVQSQGPAILLYYENQFGKLHKRVMPLRNLTSTSDVGIVVAELRNKHRQYLTTLTDARLQKLVRIARERLKGLRMDEVLRKIDRDFSVNPDEDLNKADAAVLQLKKDIMNETFEANHKKPGDPDFRYDVEVDFDRGVIEGSEWDSDKEDQGF